MMPIAKQAKLRFIALLSAVLFTQLACAAVWPAYAHADEQIMATTDAAISLEADKTATVYLSGDSASAVKWESTDEQVAIIESSTTRKAVVKGVGKGTAGIVATDAVGNSATCEVTVSVPAFTVDESMKLTVDSSGSIHAYQGSAVSWTSSNDDIVSITDSGSRSAYVRAESVGTAVITATDKFGSEATCTVRVRQQDFEIQLDDGLSSDEGYEDEYSSAAEFDYYWHSYSVNSPWWDDDFNYHEYTYYYQPLTSYRVEASEGAISKCVSGNTKVACVVKEYGGYYVYPKGVGTTIITAIDSYGEEETFTCTVTLNYFIDRETQEVESDGNEEWTTTKKEYTYKNNKYGSGTLQGVTFNKAKVTATINGKTYSTTASGGGKYSIKVPKYIKLNTPITIKATQYNVTKTYKRHVVSNKPGISLSSVKPGSKVVQVKLSNVHKGDYVKLKVGKKTYKKKIKRDKKSVTLKIKTVKQKKGQKVTATVYNKYKQKLRVKSKKIK